MRSRYLVLTVVGGLLLGAWIVANPAAAAPKKETGGSAYLRKQKENLENEQRKKKEREKNYWRKIRQQEKSAKGLFPSYHGHEETWAGAQFYIWAPGLPGSDPLDKIEDAARTFFPTRWLNEHFYEKGLDVLRHGNPKEYSRYRRHLRDVINDSDSRIEKLKRPYRKKKVREKIGATIGRVLPRALILPANVRADVDDAAYRGYRARQALHDLPRNFMPGFVNFYPDGTTYSADPDSFEQLMLMREGESIRDIGGDGGGGGAD